MKLTKHKLQASLTGKNLQNQLRCVNTNFKINLKMLRGRREKQISRSEVNAVISICLIFVNF